MPPPSRPPVVRPVPGQRTFYRLAAILMVVGLLYWAKSILIPIALAVLLAFALSPLAVWLERRGLGRAAGSLLVSVAALGLLGGLGYVAVSQGRQLAVDFEKPEYEANLRDKFGPVLGLVDRLEHLGAAAGADPVEKPGGQPARTDTPVPGQPVGGSAPVPVTVVPPKGAKALEWLPSLALPAAEGLATALLVAVLTIFLLIQREGMRDRLLALAGRRQLTTTTRALEDAGRRVSRFLLLQACTNAAMGLVVCVGLYLAGVPYAALWGLLTAALRFVPYVGIWLSALFPLTLALAHFPGWTPALLVLAVYAGFDLVLTNVIEPLLFGHGTGVSAVALLVAAAFWAFLWGPVGLLLAVPLTVCLVVLGEHIPSLTFLRTMLGEEAQVDPAARFFHRVLSRQPDEAALLVGEQAVGRPLLDVYDDVILPAVAQAKTERDQGDLSADDEREFYRTARQVMNGVLAGTRVDAGAADTPTGGARAVGCSTKGEADRLALYMLRDVARPAGCEVELVPAAKLVEAVAARVGRGEDVSACIGAVSPGGLAQAAGLCKELRRRFPKLEVVVGRWGVTEDRAGTEKFLADAGASAVTWQLRETVAAVAPAAPPKEEPAGPATPAQPGQVSVPA